MDTILEANPTSELLERHLFQQRARPILLPIEEALPDRTRMLAAECRHLSPDALSIEPLA
jgi:hypothetical protein